MKNKLTYQNPDLLLEVIHNFLKFTSTAETYQEVFTAITKNFMEMLHIEECVVYEAFPKQGKLFQRAIHGSINPKGEMNNRIQEINYGEGIVGWVAENQQTICSPNNLKEPRYIVDRFMNLSELAVPIQFNGELFGVIDAENSKENYYTEQHVQLFELIADFAANLLIRIRQKDELENLKLELEELLDEKNQALEYAIEKVSNQVSELKYHQEKKEILLREVHHRVNNNLQILSSVINIYLTETEHIDAETLREIKNKIQTLSSIHLILLKSVENNKTKVIDFLLDLIASIRYMNQSNYLILEAISSISFLPMNTLIPLGLLINEVVNASAELYWEKGEAVEIMIHLEEEGNELLLVLKTSKEFHLKQLNKLKAVNQILIESYINQLDGENLASKDESILWKIKLCQIE
ncbi:MAG: GAF domain-containing protein [Flavobacteriia bacterium]